MKMKRYIYSLILLVTFVVTPIVAESTQLHAKDIVIDEVEQYPFIGLVGSYNGDFNNTMLVGFRFGMQNNLWRTSFTYEDNFDEYKAFMIEVDRTVVAGLFNGKGRIYIGASGGWVDVDDGTIEIVTLDENGDEESTSKTGYAIGLNIGLMYYISDQLDFSIDYRYMSVEDIVSMDTISALSLSLHYFF
jgi:opacity protein-like surface antigen